MTGLAKGVVFGVVAGLIGAAIWAAIVYEAHLEIGWLAWGIGAAVGGAVGFGCGQAAGPHSGGIAVVIALLAIVGGKYAAVSLMADHEIDIDQMHADELAKLNNEEYLISWVADAVVDKEEDAGRKVQWPDGVDTENAERESDYPPQIWAKAKSIWQQMSDEEKQQHRADITESLNQGRQSLIAIKSDIVNKAFKESFTPLDIVFFVLGAITAWGMGSKPLGAA